MKFPPSLPPAASPATQPPPPRRLELRDLAELLTTRPKAPPEPPPPAPEAAAPQASADQRPLRPGSRLDIKV